MTVEELLNATEYNFPVVDIWDGRMFHTYHSDGFSRKHIDIAVTDFGHAGVRDWNPTGEVDEEGGTIISIEISVA